MENEYIQEEKLIEKTEEEKDIDLIRSVIKTKIELEVANRNFEYADGDLIDYYTYQIKANQAKLGYLLKKVKNRSLVLDMVNELKLRLFEDKAI
jgi:hypothetical protein